MLDNLQAVLNELNKRKLEFAKAVMSDDRSVSGNTKKLDWQEAAYLYGDVRTPLTQTLGHKQATGITHTWRDLQTRAGTENVGTERGSGTNRGDGIPTGHKNTCQILDDKVEVSGSAAEEARRGVYGPETSEVDFQTNYKMKAIMQDLEWTTLYGLEVTESGASSSHQRKMKGLVGTPGTYNGLIQTNVMTVASLISGQDHLTADAVDSFLEAIFSSDAGEMPDTMYVSGKTAMRLAAINTAAQFTFTMSDLQNILQNGMPIGRPVGYWLSPFGWLKIKLHPKIADNSGASSSNFLMVINEGLVRYADFRELQAEALAKSGDSEDKLIIVELSLELLAEKAAGILHTFDPTAAS